MADVKQAYGTNGQTITCTLASLASSSTAGRESASIDNRTNKYLDALVFVKVKIGAGTIGSDQAVYVYVAGTVDDGTTWPDTVTGADAAITMNSPQNARLLGVIYAVAQSTTYKAGPWSVAQAFGGSMPAEWSIIVRNFSGIALDATEGNHAKLYQGVYATVV